MHARTHSNCLQTRSCMANHYSRTHCQAELIGYHAHRGFSVARIRCSKANLGHHHHHRRRRHHNNNNTAQGNADAVSRSVPAQIIHARRLHHKNNKTHILLHAVKEVVKDRVCTAHFVDLQNRSIIKSQEVHSTRTNTNVRAVAKQAMR